MTLNELLELVGNNGEDYDLFMPDGLPITGVVREGDNLYLSDTVEGLEDR